MHPPHGILPYGHVFFSLPLFLTGVEEGDDGVKKIATSRNTRQIILLSIIGSIAAIVSFSCVNNNVFASHSKWPDLDDSLSLTSACKNISRHIMSMTQEKDTSLFIDFYNKIDSMGHASLAKKSALPSLTDSICARVYTDWSITYDANDTSFLSLLPHDIVANKHGACLGVSLIMLMLAEQMNCPLFGVMLPGHFFCRFDDGNIRYNIEPNKNGYHHPDSYYQNRYALQSNPWYDLHSMTKQEVIGVLCYNTCTILLARHTIKEALFYGKQAMRRLPKIPEVQGNYALCLAQNGNNDSALIVFSRLYNDCPNFNNCALNYGALLLSQKQYDSAAIIFAKGLRYFPNDTNLQNRLSLAQSGKPYNGTWAGLKLPFFKADKTGKKP